MRRFPLPRTLRSRLLGLVALSLLPAFGLVLYVSSQERDQSLAQARSEVMRVARQAGSHQERLIEGSRKLLLTLSKVPAARNRDGSTLSPLLADLLKEDPAYANLGAVDPDGIVFASALPYEGKVDLSERSWFVRCLQRKEFAVGDYQVGKITQRATVNCAFPVLNDRRDLRAVLYAALDLDWMRRTSFGTALPEDGVVMMLDGAGTVLVRSPELAGVEGRQTGVPALLTVAEGEGGEEGVFQAVGADGKERLYAYMRLPHGFVLCLGHPVRLAYAAAERSLWQGTLAVTLAGIVAAAVAWFGSSLFVVKPIRSLVEATQKLAGGDLSVRSGFPDRTGEIGQLAGAFDDLASSLERSHAERRQTEETIRRLAYHDALTGLPNRTQLHGRILKSIREHEGAGALAAVLLLDLDRFKEINDSLGHNRGDLFLQLAGKRLEATVGDKGVVARLGGDEFGVVLPGAGLEQAVRKTLDILEAFGESFTLEDLRVDVNVSIGIALSPDHGEDPDGLVRKAEVAMYAAKRTSKGYALYDAVHDPYKPERLALLAGLRRAVEDEKLHLVYQPKVDLVSNRVVGVEALSRWTHPQLGNIPPDQFIPLAEQTGLIRPLTRWAVGRAIEEFAPIRPNGGAPVAVAVNLSAEGLEDLRLPEEISQRLAEAGVEPGQLELEVTESALMRDPERAIQILRDLHQRGFRIYVDDFGTGYSSLAYLKRLPLDGVKIDKSFVLDMKESEEAATIVRAMIDLAHDLGLSVVAEGIEDVETCRRLAALGCDVGQGYYLGRPLLGPEIARWLEHPGEAAATGD